MSIPKLSLLTLLLAYLEDFHQLDKLDTVQAHGKHISYTNTSFIKR